MSDGRTIWLAKDVAWWRRERIVALGEEFGADGPAVIDWMSCEAKAQNDRGRVKTGARSIARGSFVPLVTVCHVLSRAVTLCLLDDYSEIDGLITCRISGFEKDDARARAAVRQQKKRSKEADSADPSHALSRPVTESHRKFDREEKRTTTPLIPRSGGNDFPTVPDGNRDRDRARYSAECRQLSKRLFPNGPAQSAENCVDQAVRYGAQDEAAVVAHAQQWFPDLREVA